jgi:hypothetical protein
VCMNFGVFEVCELVRTFHSVLQLSLGTPTLKMAAIVVFLKLDYLYVSTQCLMPDRVSLNWMFTAVGTSDVMKM